ncbi:MAG: polysaccharide biosynthesis/export family protein [Candidatus Aminicenantes bacterium]|nr:polysaccharide biosynthesis/export family protein [Candidatus Aminicenantes bacterium]
MKKILTISISVAFVLILSVPSLFSQEESRSDYKIGPKDELEISVTGWDEVSKTVRVSEDGKINLPYLGTIEVEGLTITQLERKLTELLEQDYIQNPQVTVFISKFLSKIVYVDGAVGNPGTYELRGRQYLMQIITQAGGLTPEAGKEIHVIRHHSDGTSDSLKISIDDLYYKVNSDLNIPLEAGDIINVPFDKVIRVFVMGQVRNPGALEFKSSEMPTLLKAIAAAGGFAERASKGGVTIKRRDETGKEITIKVNANDILKGKKRDIPLQENDVINIPETFF